MNDFTFEPDFHPSVIEPLDFYGPNDVSEKLGSIIEAAKEIGEEKRDNELIRRLEEIRLQIKECKSRVYKWKADVPSFCSTQAVQHSTYLAITNLFELADHNPVSPDEYLAEVIEDLERWGNGFDTWNMNSLKRVHRSLADAREGISLDR